MSNLKERIDLYLQTNQTTIEHKRTNSRNFRWSDVAKKIDKEANPEHVRHRFLALRKKSDFNISVLNPTSEPKSKTKFPLSHSKENKDNKTKEFTFTADSIPTEEEIINHFNIDTTKWTISQIYHKTSFGGKYAITVNQRQKEAVYAVNYEKEFKDFIEKYNVSKLLPATKQKQTETLSKSNSVLLNLSDLHVGKLAWEKEVGSDYNVDLAKDVFLKALKHLAYQSIRCFGVEEFVLNIGGDFLHTNGSLNQTANGTNMNDVDTRYQKIYIKGLEILTEAVDFLSSFEGVKVKLFIVQGNHDKATSFYLGESVKAFYRKDKNIEIMNDPHIRKYHKYGVSSYMLTHGDCKDEGLPLTFATEKPDYFASSEYRYIYLGHLHKTSKKVFLTENEVSGVVLRRLNSLSVMDSWHNENNYFGAKRMANAIIFDKDLGQIGEFNYIVKK